MNRALAILIGGLAAACGEGQPDPNQVQVGPGDMAVMTPPSVQMTCGPLTGNGATLDCALDFTVTGQPVGVSRIASDSARTDAVIPPGQAFQLGSMGETILPVGTSRLVVQFPGHYPHSQAHARLELTDGSVMNVLAAIPGATGNPPQIGNPGPQTPARFVSDGGTSAANPGVGVDADTLCQPSQGGAPQVECEITFRAYGKSDRLVQVTSRFGSVQVARLQNGSTTVIDPSQGVALPAHQLVDLKLSLTGLRQPVAPNQPVTFDVRFESGLSGQLIDVARHDVD